MRLLKNIGSSSFLLCLVWIIACVEPYSPPAIKGRKNFLVVDGFLNATTGEVIVNLSRSIPLSDTTDSPRELNANLTLEDTDGNSFFLYESSPGVYKLSSLMVDFSRKYRLSIRTANNKEYQSDFIEIKASPVIDSLNWKPTTEGVKIYVNTHDDTDQTRYYQWFTEETYHYTSAWSSTYKLINGVPQIRPLSEKYYECYSTEVSGRILIGTSQQLSHDIIREFTVASIPKGSKKLFSRYSILITQRAITKEAYEFYDKLKKTTEDLGGLFDPQPGQVMGNIHAVNSNETVLGFFSGGSEQQERIFIKLMDLPEYLRFYLDRTSCWPDSVDAATVNTVNPSLFDLIDGLYKDGPTIIGYTFAEKICTDCRLQGGTIERPEFW